MTTATPHRPIEPVPTLTFSPLAWLKLQFFCHHGDTEIVSKTVEDGAIHRYTYREAHRRARRLAKAMKALGVQMHDRVGTLAWNTYRHFELYFGTSGIGAVCHTVNPRLFQDDIAWIVNHAQDRWIVAALLLVALGVALGGATQLHHAFHGVYVDVHRADRRILGEARLHVSGDGCIIDILAGKEVKEQKKSIAKAVGLTIGQAGIDKALAFLRRVKLSVFPEIPVCSGLQDFLRQFDVHFILERRDFVLKFFLKIGHFLPGLLPRSHYSEVGTGQCLVLTHRRSPAHAGPCPLRNIPIPARAPSSRPPPRLQSAGACISPDAADSRSGIEPSLGADPHSRSHDARRGARRADSAPFHGMCIARMVRTSSGIPPSWIRDTRDPRFSSCSGVLPARVCSSTKECHTWFARPFWAFSDARSWRAPSWPRRPRSPSPFRAAS